MGARGSTPSHGDYYPIRLQPEQSVMLYGFTHAKTTLTWADVLAHRCINLATCVQCGVDAGKLHMLQPDIKQWIANGKASLADIPLMGAWKVDPFKDLDCTVGELVIHRQVLTPQLLIACGYSFEVLRQRYGLTTEIMPLLKYSLQEWAGLGVTADFVTSLSDDSFDKIYGGLSRATVISCSVPAAAGTTRPVSPGRCPCAK